MFEIIPECICDDTGAHYHGCKYPHDVLTALPRARTDRELLAWLAQRGRWVTHQDRDCFSSFHLERKSVHFYVDGKYTVVDGDDLYLAINNAIDVFENHIG